MSNAAQMLETIKTIQMADEKFYLVWKETIEALPDEVYERAKDLFQEFYREPFRYLFTDLYKTVIKIYGNLTAEQFVFLNNLYEDARTKEWYLDDFIDTKRELLVDDPLKGSDYYLAFSEKYMRFAELANILKIHFLQTQGEDEEYYDFLDRSRHVLIIAIGGLLLYNEDFDMAFVEISDVLNENINELTDSLMSADRFKDTLEKYYGLTFVADEESQTEIVERASKTQKKFPWRMP